MPVTAWGGTHNAALLYAGLIRKAASVGLRISVRSDFEEFVSNYRSLTGQETHPVFDPAASDVDGHTAFWICGEDGAGRVCHVQAVRLWDLGSGTLVEHLSRHVSLYCRRSDVEIDPNLTDVRGENCSALRGRVAYHGGLCLAGEYRKQLVRGVPLGREILPRLASILAYLALDPDYIFGMAPYPTAEKGLLASYGFYHADLAALAFRNAAGDLLWHETILWQSRAELREEFRRSFERFGDER